MKKSEISNISAAHAHYIHLNEDISLKDAFLHGLSQLEQLDLAQLKRIGTKPYAEGKWSIHQLIQHITDWERIWCYRALIAARNEGSIPDGHDENKMADHSNANNIPIEQLMEEFRLVRMASIALFDTFSEEILHAPCRFYQQEMAIGAVGFGMIGHQLHHLQILKERYLPLDPQIQ